MSAIMTFHDCCATLKFSMIFAWIFYDSNFPPGFPDTVGTLMVPLLLFLNYATLLLFIHVFHYSDMYITHIKQVHL
jgi:hypothetical protein